LGIVDWVVLGLHWVRAVVEWSVQGGSLVGQEFRVCHFSVFEVFQR